MKFREDFGEEDEARLTPCKDDELKYTEISPFKAWFGYLLSPYTQIKIQMLTGIDQSDYSKLENGKRYYTFEQCRKLGLALDTSMDYLTDLTDDPKPYPKKKSK